MGIWPDIKGIPSQSVDGPLFVTGGKGGISVVPVSILKEPTGFSDPASVIVTYDPTTQQITLTGTWTAYYQGVLIPAFTTGWVSAAHTNTTGHTYHLYYDGAFKWSTDTFPDFAYLHLAYVHYGAVDKFACRECHGFMNWQAHESIHDTVGARRDSGGTLGGYTLSSTTAAQRRPSVSECVIMDEDLQTTNAALADNGPYTQMYLAGAAVTTSALAATEIVPVSGSHPYYNSFSTPNWGQTLMPANSVATVWLIEMPAAASANSQAYRHTWIQPQWITQATSGSAVHMSAALASEIQRLPSELNLGDLFAVTPEFVPIAKIVIEYTGGNWDIVNVTDLTGSRYNLTGAPAGLFLSGVTPTAPLTGSGTVASPLSIPLATSAVSGYLGNSDWATFNGKLSDAPSDGNTYGRNNGAWAVAGTGGSGTGYAVIEPKTSDYAATVTTLGKVWMRTDADVATVKTVTQHFSLDVPAISDTEIMIVAGGGGAYGNRSGGGGGGGVVNVTGLTTTGALSVVVGAGGPGGNPSGNGAGSNSSFDTYVAHGGGTSGSPGGSGGGANAGGSIGSASPVGEGYDGGAATSPDGRYGAGGGGGGGGHVGYGVTYAPEGYHGGNGGEGYLSSINGTPTYYAGGGGGGKDDNGGYVGSGGAGGGGGGGYNNVAGIAGTVNTGGGGGGGGGYYGTSSYVGGAGGKGIVIIRYLTTHGSASGGTITTDGLYTVHTFNSSGTFTVLTSYTQVYTVDTILPQAGSGSASAYTTAPLTGNGAVATPIAMPQATASISGYLGNTDWSTFNTKVATSRTITTTAPLTGGGDLSSNRTVSMPLATTAVSGYLGNSDWATFNGKLSDAPSDGVAYNRKNAAWEAASTASGSATGYAVIEPTTSDYAANATNSGKMWMRTDAATATVKMVAAFGAAISAEMLIVAGGGSGSSTRGPGGGAGGLLYYSATSISLGNVTVTVGGGGSGDETAGTNSSFGTLAIAYRGGSRVTTTSVGSGAGGAPYDTAGKPGLAGQGKDGGAGEGPDGAQRSAGGGGGAGANGAAGASQQGGAGGAGLAYNISGATAFYAGGGGGGKDGTGGAAGAGGSSIGGNGQRGVGTVGQPGVVNTGSGGGGGGGTYGVVGGTPGNGGSGVVIIKYLTSGNSATGGNITTSGAYTIHTFTGTGTFSATAGSSNAYAVKTFTLT